MYLALILLATKTPPISSDGQEMGAMAPSPENACKKI
jgi:hypothetical protein